jgi:hypothetical protein
MIDPRALEFLKKQGYKFPEAPAVPQLGMTPPPEDSPISLESFLPAKPAPAIPIPAAPEAASPMLAQAIPEATPAPTATPTPEIVPEAAPTLKKPPLSFQNALGLALAGYGDALSARGGGTGTAMKSATAQIQSDRERQMQNQQITIQQAQKEKQKAAIRKTLSMATGKPEQSFVGMEDNPILDKYMDILKPKTAAGKSFGYTRDQKGNFFHEGRKINPKDVPANAEVYLDDSLKVDNQSIDKLLVNPAEKEIAFTKTGEEFLKHIKPEFRSAIMGIASGKTLPSQLVSTRFGGAENLYSLASQYSGAPIDATVFGQRQQSIKDFSSGKTSQNIKAINTAIKHLDTLKQAGVELQNNPVQGFNRLKNWYKTQTGNAAPVKFDAAKIAIADEIGTILKGTGATDTQISHLLQEINSKQSPEQLAGVADTFTEIMGGRLSAIKGQWEATMGDQKFNFIYPEQQKILKKYGYNENLEKVGKAAGGEASYSQDVLEYAKKYNIPPAQAQAVKDKRGGK